MAKTEFQGEGFRVQTEIRPGHLRAFVFDGADSLAVSLAYWTHLREQCRQTGQRNLLVVENLVPAHVGEEEFNALIAAMVGMGYQELRVAFVSLQAPLQTNEQGMILGNEQGLTLMAFSSESVAERWIRFA